MLSVGPAEMLVAQELALVSSKSGRDPTRAFSQQPSGTLATA